MWNDDLHHNARVAVTGRREAYETDYRGTPTFGVEPARFVSHHAGWRLPAEAAVLLAGRRRESA